MQKQKGKDYRPAAAIDIWIQDTGNITVHRGTNFEIVDCRQFMPVVSLIMEWIYYTPHSLPVHP